MKLKKIHHGISFIEEAWLKPYIELNTQLRTKATNDFETDFFKLIILYLGRRWKIFAIE